jgi:hypothetical protein
MTPLTASAGSSAISLVLKGNFPRGGPTRISCRLLWMVDGNVTALATTFIDDSHLVAAVPAELLKVPAHVQLFSESYDMVSGGADQVYSNFFEFSVLPAGSATTTPTGSMSKARSNHTAVLLADGAVLILGGGESSAEVFDPATGAFSPAGNMQTEPVTFSSSALLQDGKVLVVGGAGDHAELYDPATRTFAETGRMVHARASPTVTVLEDGKVLVVGGVDESAGGGGAALDQAEIFDPGTGTFALTGRTVSPRANHTATLLGTGKVLIAGGRNGHGADGIDDPPWDPLFAEVYDPVSGQFTTTGDMTTTRIGHSATALGDGRVLMLGGVSANQNVHMYLNPSSAETYDSGSGNFSTQSQLALWRTGHTATALDDGSILVAGGDILGTPTSAIVQFSPDLTKITIPGALLTARSGHTATRLLDGRVLITGGIDDHGNVLATAEIYE